MNIAVIGVGAYAIALTKMLGKNSNNKIKMWTESSANVKEYKETKRFVSILNVDLPNNLVVSNSYEEVLNGADIIFIMVAAQYLDNVSAELKKYVSKKEHIVIGSKGIEQDTCLFADELVLKNIKTKKIAVLSGPSFAIDMAADNPIGLTIASNSKSTIKMAKKALENGTVKLWPTNDIVGTEICGSIKNVLAIAAGMIDGMGYKDSTPAFLITEGLHDIKELLHKLGGNKNSILSFAGVGDILLTCTSTKSRNFTFGRMIGNNKSKKEIDEYLKNTTVEGYYTLKSIYSLVKRKNVDMPIIDLIYKIVLEGENPNLLIKYLINKK